jgi:hypothetical protein
MTRQEHLFMLTIFAMQNAKYNRLIEILKTRGVLEGDDLQAFRAIVPEEVRERLEWFQEAWETYQTTRCRSRCNNWPRTSLVSNLLKRWHNKFPCPLTAIHSLPSLSWLVIYIVAEIWRANR